jgi:hypothetical protein
MVCNLWTRIPPRTTAGTCCPYGTRKCGISKTFALAYHFLMPIFVRSVHLTDHGKWFTVKLTPIFLTQHTNQHLSAFRDWGRCVKRIVRTALAEGGPTSGPKVRLSDLGYVRTNALVPQHWHRDVPVNHPYAAYSVFMPVNVICPRSDPSAFKWRHLNDETKLIHVL